MEPLLLLWKLVWLLVPFLQLLLAIQASDSSSSSEREDFGLRVTLRKDHLERAPSCVYTFAQLELLNLHTTDYIDILSIRVATEETNYVPNNNADADQPDNDEHAQHHQLPRQLHISRLPAAESLSLGPGQVAIVPVSFLPRFPNRKMSHHDHHSSLTVARQIDLEEWFQQSWEDLVELEATGGSGASGGAPRSNQWHYLQQQQSPLCLPEEYRVSTEIIVKTNRGKVTLPIQVSSVRTNDYGLPSVILFSPIDQYHQHDDPDSPYYSETAALASRLQQQAKRSSRHYQQQAKQAKHQSEPAVNRPGTFHPEYRMVSRKLEAPQRDDESFLAANEAAATYIHANHDCYDLYIKHPLSSRGPTSSSSRSNLAEADTIRGSDYSSNDNDNNNNIQLEPLLIKEVALRNAESVGLFILPGKEQSVSLVASTSVTQSLRDFTTNGSLAIPADDQSHYVCTVCTMASSNDFWNMEDLDSTQTAGAATGGGDELFLQDLQHHLQTAAATAPNALGYLQIRTDMDTLIVALERASDDNDEEDEEDDDDDNDENDHDDVLDDHGTTVAVDEFAASTRDHHDGENDMETPDVVPLDRPTPADTDVGDHYNSEYDDHPDKGDDEEESGEWTEPMLHADPEFVDIHLLSSASPFAKVPIDVYNGGSLQPVTIMRMSAMWSSREPDLDDRVGFEVTLPGEGLDERISIEFNETLEDAFFFECSIDWDKFARDEALSDVHFTGSVILRGSSRNWDYDEWESALSVNPYMDSDFVLEIPFAVTVIKGKIGFVLEQTTYPQSIFWLKEPWKEHIESVSGAFFPLTPADVKRSFGREDIESFVQHERMEHQLRVFSNVDVETEVRGVEIVDDVIYREGRSQKMSDSKCEHFEVSFTDLRNDRVSDPFGLPDHTDLGLVHLTYHFTEEAVDATKDGLNNRTTPTVCYLRLTTEPDTGNHLTPLIVYSASVEVSGNTFQPESMPVASASEDVATTVWQRTIVGFERLLSYVQQTRSGATLRSALESLLVTRRLGQESDSALLGRYLYQLADHSLHSDYSKLRPIMLEAGAIAQGELETFPLYLTNHNPVPIKAMIDVGEVEGMSISVGREASSKGDGHSLLDHLPRKPVVRRARTGGYPIFEPLVESGNYQDHPINGLRQFLLHDEIASKYLTQFPYRDAISLSDSAVDRMPLLDKLFRAYAVVDFHRTSLPDHFSPTFESQCGQTLHPPMYGSFDSKITSHSGPLIISSDGRTSRNLPVCWSRQRRLLEAPIEGTSIMLPPGGSIRFDVNLRAPPNSVLEKDITQFLATGLVLSTDHGDIMPIFVSFEALQGKLDITHIPSPHRGPERVSAPFEDTEGAIRVPIGLFSQGLPPKAAVILNIPPRYTKATSKIANSGIVTRNVSVDETGVSLYMKSSFSRDVRLREISSCNPWFQVILKNNSGIEPDPFLGVNIGTVKSVVSCEQPSGRPTNATGFFRCALNWLAKRSELQPRGCGLRRKKEKHSSLDIHGNAVAERTCVERAIRAFKRVLLVDELTKNPVLAEYDRRAVNLANKSSRRSSDGIVPDFYVDAVADAWDAWHTVSELGLRRLSTNLRAVIEYNSTANDNHPDRTHILSLALPNLTIESILDPPRLLDASNLTRAISQHARKGNVHDSPSIISFPDTLVSGISALFLPLRNPTDIPVRVRLAVISPKRSDRSDFLREAETESIGIDVDVIERYLGDLSPPYVQTGLLAKDSLGKISNDYWWNGDGAFMLSNFEGDVIRSYHNATIVAGAGAQVSISTPSLLGNTALLAGCGPGCGVRQEIPKHKAAASNPIGASASVGITLSGRQRRYKKSYENYAVSDSRSILAGGSLRSGGTGPSAFAMPFSSLDEIVIPPYGTAKLGPILFRPPGRFSSLGCEAKSNSGLTGNCNSSVFKAMVLLENSLSGLERVEVQGKALWEKVAFLDPVKQDAPDSFGDIELREGRTALVFTGKGIGADIKEVVVSNMGDLEIAFKSVSFSHTAMRRARATPIREAQFCEFRNFILVDCESLKHGFVLQPGQNKSIHIMYQPDCSKRKDFVSLNFMVDRSARPQGTSESLIGQARFARVNGISQLMQRNSVGLLVGYDMSKKTFASCRPAGSPIDVAIRRTPGQNVTFTAGSVDHEKGEAFTELLVMILMAGSFLILLAGVWKRELVSREFSVRLGDNQKLERNEFLPVIDGVSWSAAFRCLSRADPTAIELQTLGREQVRHIVLTRYRAKEILQPQCLSKTGAFNRERGNAGIGRHVQGSKDSSGSGNGGGSDRVRTISDAIFFRFRPLADEKMGLLPCNLGWKTAVARGIIDISSVRKSTILTSTEALLKRRQQEEMDQDAEKSESDLDSGSNDESGSVSVSSESIQEEEEIVRAPTKLLRSASSHAAADSTRPEKISFANGSQTREVVELQSDELNKTKFATGFANTDTKSIITGLSAQSNTSGLAPRGKNRKLTATNVSDRSHSQHGSTSQPPPSPKSANSKAPTISKPTKAVPVSSAQLSQDQSSRIHASTSLQSKEVKPVVVEQSAQHSAPQKDDQEQQSDIVSKESETEDLDRRSLGEPAVVPLTEEDIRAAAATAVPPPNVDRVVENAEQMKDPLAAVVVKSDLADKKRAKDLARKRGEAIVSKEDRRAEDVRKKEKLKPLEHRGKDKHEKSKRIKSSPATVDVLPKTDPETKAWKRSETASPQAGPPLRLPPGLIPPPGFGQPAVDNNAAIAAASSILADTKPYTYSNAFGGAVRQSVSVDSGEKDSSSPLVGTRSSPRTSVFGSAEQQLRFDEDELYDDRGMYQGSSTDGFNVMDFLDGILNDGSNAPYEDDTEAQVAEEDETYSDDAPLVALNPWATTTVAVETSVQSRLSAYGISIDDGSDRLGEDAFMFSSSDLLTPADILATDTKGEAQDDGNEGRSLYSSLMEGRKD